MPLTQEQITALLSIPDRCGGSKKKELDTSVRDYQTWFKLATKMVDESTGELLHCTNPDCSDPRAASGQGGIVVAEVNGSLMCRYCFFDNWLLISE
jgi:hypothetical protein